MNPSQATSEPGAMPLLSLVVLVYNTAPYLPACFDSLLSQRYTNIEILAIDDSSSDDSLAICRDYEARHPNFRCLTKDNEGGAVSGNLGIAMARGEYVALVDSDDVVTHDGYALLIAEALRCDADIVIGRAARLTDEGIRSSVAFLYEPFVWTRRRVIESVAEFPDIIHDGFYWNKVFRTAFLREHRLGMVPGLLYADRPFVHKAYFLSRRIAIIPELVYLWRVRAAGGQASITQAISTADNFSDRMRSVAIEWNDFANVPAGEAYRRAIAVTNLQRALYTAIGVVSSPSFRKVFVPAMQQLLALYGDLDYRSLGARRSLYLELIKTGQIEGLCFLLGVTMENCWIAEIDGACYWRQPFLENPEVPIAREVMRIDFPTIGFFRLCGAQLTGQRLLIELEMHDWITARCDELDLELHSLYGEGGIPLQPMGRLRTHVYGFELSLDQAWEPGGLYGLILQFRSGGIQGRYRIGLKMMLPEVLLRLPLDTSRGRLLHSPEAGGVGFAVD